MTFYLQSRSPPPLAEALFCQDFLSFPEALYLSKVYCSQKETKHGTEFTLMVNKTYCKHP